MTRAATDAILNAMHAPQKTGAFHATCRCGQDFTAYAPAERHIQATCHRLSVDLGAEARLALSERLVEARGEALNG